MRVWVAIRTAAARIAGLARRRKPLPLSPARILIPFTGGGLDPIVLDAAIRIARAEHATLVPAVLIVTPLQFDLDRPMNQQVGLATPLLEAVEHAALRAGVGVDARVETGRTPTHALQRLWEAERFERIVLPAPVSREPGFTPKELLWMLTNAPTETLILRPDPSLHPVANRRCSTRVMPVRRRSRHRARSVAAPTAVAG
jgi:hypothetical protein